MRISAVILHNTDIERPQCANCGTHMWLARIEPDKPGFDKRTFECPVCDVATTRIVQYK